MRNTENVTISIPKTTVQKMKKFRQIRWSVVAGMAIEDEVKRLEGEIELRKLDQILSRSKLTEKDAERIGHKIKHEMSKRFL